MSAKQTKYNTKKFNKKLKMEAEDMKIVFISENKLEGSKEILNKLESEQKILKLLKGKEVTKIEVFYKNKESAFSANSNN